MLKVPTVVVRVEIIVLRVQILVRRVRIIVLKVRIVVRRVRIIVLRVRIIVLKVQIVVLRVRIIVLRVRIIVREDAGRVAEARCAAFAPVVPPDVPALRSRAQAVLKGTQGAQLGTQGPYTPAALPPAGVVQQSFGQPHPRRVLSVKPQSLEPLKLRSPNP